MKKRPRNFTKGAALIYLIAVMKTLFVVRHFYSPGNGLGFSADPDSPIR